MRLLVLFLGVVAVAGCVSAGSRIGNDLYQLDIGASPVFSVDTDVLVHVNRSDGGVVLHLWFGRRQDSLVATLRVDPNEGEVQQTREMPIEFGYHFYSVTVRRGQKLTIARQGPRDSLKAKILSIDSLPQ